MSDTLSQRYEQLQARIASACARAGRETASVQLVAVSKTQGPEAVREAADCGLLCFGENKVQEARAKIPLCPGHLSWHLIGHLQRNKVDVAVQLFDMIHSVDSLRLLESLQRACDETGRRMKVLLEVNVAGEASKFGLPPGEVASLVGAANGMDRIELRGLMAIPPFVPEPEKARPFFRALRECRDRVQRETGTPLPELSMGMSHDFDVAIEEGADWIRVGTALFGERVKAAPKPGTGDDGLET